MFVAWVIDHRIIFSIIVFKHRGNKAYIWGITLNYDYGNLAYIRHGHSLIPILSENIELLYTIIFWNLLFYGLLSHFVCFETYNSI